ncbi:hypothetical protein Agabi119p4_2411 [Agaricus bisporus var. burnettii]|uniref:Uncharacterized protein n=1 Tax=Agaricus bisporus var. burnettii TaxID=192524 RepID=A0A8H7F909_AGABI|nr:hypothetical protein Agabi119p4_2411 [Agaricus bisporus var. burnettii]
MTHPRGLPFWSHGLSPLFGLRRTSPSFGVLNQYVAVIDHDFMTRRAATPSRVVAWFSWPDVMDTSSMIVRASASGLLVT